MNPPPRHDLPPGPFPSSEVRGDPIVPVKMEELPKALLFLAGQIWRLATAVVDSETNEVKTTLSTGEARKLGSAIEAMQQSIKDLGIRVIDRCGEDFHPGLPDQVITEEPREGITRDRVIRTIRPTILWNQTMVQRGEIDIAVPAAKH